MGFLDSVFDYVSDLFSENSQEQGKQIIHNASRPVKNNGETDAQYQDRLDDYKNEASKLDKESKNDSFGQSLRNLKEKQESDNAERETKTKLWQSQRNKRKKKGIQQDANKNGLLSQLAQEGRSEDNQDSFGRQLSAFGDLFSNDEEVTDSYGVPDLINSLANTVNPDIALSSMIADMKEKNASRS